MRKAQATQSRIILVGDTQQLNSIEAWAPFRLLQERSNLKTVTLSENLRQKTPHLFIAANLAAEQQTNKALETLDRHQSIQEFPDLDQRNQSVAEQYLAREPREQARTLILCDTNQDRQAITDQIRANYITNGTLGQTSRTLAILYSKKLDPQALTQAYSYQKGDVIRFTRRNTPFPDAYYRVAEVKDQSLMLKGNTGQLQEMPLAQYKEREVYQYQSLEIRQGDRLRFTRNQRTRQYCSVKSYAVLRIAKVRFSSLALLSLCLLFLAGNFALVFLTTLGLLLACLGGILQSKISAINQLKKGGFPLGWIAEIVPLLGAPP